MSAPGQIQLIGTLIPSDVTSHPFNLAESYAPVRLDSAKPDNLRPNGDYDEFAMVVLARRGLWIPRKVCAQKLGHSFAFLGAYNIFV